MRHTLALDISTMTGWALRSHFDQPGRNSPAIAYGRWGLKRRPGAIDRDMSIGYRMSALAAAIEEKIQTADRIDRIAFEAPLHLADGSSRLLIALAGVPEMIAEEAKVMCHEAHVQSVRKLVLGRARWPDIKRTVMEFCAAQGWEPADHNVADALVLLRYCEIMDRSHRAA